MEQLANKITLPTDLDRQTEMMDLLTTTDPMIDAKGKRKVSQVPLVSTTSTSPSAKKLKVFKDPFLQILDYPTPTMEIVIGEQVDTKKTLLEHQGSLKLHASQEREIT